MGGSLSVHPVIRVPMYMNSSAAFEIVLQFHWHGQRIQSEVLVNHISADFKVWPMVTELGGKETPLLYCCTAISSCTNSCLYRSPWAYLAFRYVFYLDGCHPKDNGYVGSFLLFAVRC